MTTPTQPPQSPAVPEGWVLVPVRLPAEAVSSIKDMIEADHSMYSVKARPLWASLLQIVTGLTIERQVEINEQRAMIAHQQEAEPVSESTGWRPMATAPRDGTMVRLLVDFTEHQTEDSLEPSPTIGSNNFENDGEDRWRFAGWCWSHDHFTEGAGEPEGWLPMLEPTYTAPQPRIDLAQFKDAVEVYKWHGHWNTNDNQIAEAKRLLALIAEEEGK